MSNRALQGLAVCASIVTLILIVAGALVVGTGSGLSVPDWPLSFGQFFPRMTGGVVYEHTHRLIAAGAGLLTILLAFGLWRSRLPAGVRRMGWWALGVVIVQGAFGGITVLYALPLAVNMTHAALAQTYFSILVCTAVLIADARRGDVTARPSAAAGKLRRLGIYSTAFIFLQLLAGAYLRHSGKGLHLHLAGAVIVASHVILLSAKVLKVEPTLRAMAVPARFLLFLTILQLVLGFYSWYRGALLYTSAHTAVGALLLACSSVLTVQAYRKLEIA